MSKSSLEKLIDNNLSQLMDKKGIIIDGYPRDMNQVKEFEEKVSLSSFLLFIAHPLLLFSTNKSHN